MDDLRTRAQLVAYDPGRTAGAIGAVVSRAEFVETAARGEFPATFMLDLERAETTDGGEVTAHAKLALDWDKATLDQLLASTDGDEIALLFNERDLASAFDLGEVEAHGLRQRAAVLAVAVAAAGTSATPALARFAADPSGGGGQAAGFSASPQAGREAPATQPMGAVRGLEQDQQIAGPASQATAQSPAATSSTGGVSSGDLAAIAGVGAVLISAAGFGIARKRSGPPVQLA